jgi:glycosyltransferase involved in cell wall biosynthesis
MLALRGVPADNLLVLPNPSPVPLLDTDAVTNYRATFAGVANGVLVAHVGRLVAWKGQLEFLRAFAQVAERVPTARALVIGDDAEGLNQSYVEELQRFVVQNNLSERVIFTGRIEDIHNLVAAVDIVVHSSTEPEPFGLVVTEAMALGKPVIAASFGATAEIVDDGVNGLLVDPSDTSALAEAILKLEQDAELRERFGQAGLKKAEREYSLPRYKEALEKIYDRLVAD